MSAEPSSGSFMDSKTILAIALIAVIWVVWQLHLEKKYPRLEQPISPAESVTTNDGVKDKVTESLSALSPDTKPRVLDSTIENGKRPHQVMKYSDSVWSLDFVSEGFGVSGVVLHKYFDRQGQPVQFASTEEISAFGIFESTTQTPFYFSLTKVDELTFEGRHESEGLSIRKSVRVDSKNYALLTKITVNSSGGAAPNVGVGWSDPITPHEESFLSPYGDRQEIFSAAGGDSERKSMTSEAASFEYVNINILSLSRQYFALAVLDHSPLRPKGHVELHSPIGYAKSRLWYDNSNKAVEYSIEYTAFIGPKSVQILDRLDPQMGGLVDYGMFSFLAKILLDIMNWFYSLFKNYGVAIILLTLLVRMVVLPLHLMSYKSMKGMQKIQPLIKALREQFKDDPQRMNLEMINLMKTNRVNPLGGCLPTLLQLPVFLALYQVFGHSIELYQQPFVFWIRDLSLRDPYFVLPLLMGVAMFIQMKITPTTMDPMQAKVMMFMPIIFTFFMLTLPSGLTLYIFVSTLFGIIQQWMLMREKSVESTIEGMKGVKA